MADWQFGGDVLHRDSAIPFRSDQVLLQLCLLDKDGVAVYRHSLYIYGPPPRGSKSIIKAAGEQIYSARFAESMVRSRVGRTLDWFFVVSQGKAKGLLSRQVCCIGEQNRCIVRALEVQIGNPGSMVPAWGQVWL